jgi:hypothetical protein
MPASKKKKAIRKSLIQCPNVEGRLVESNAGMIPFQICLYDSPPNGFERSSEKTVHRSNRTPVDLLSLRKNLRGLIAVFRIGFIRHYF